MYVVCVCLYVEVDVYMRRPEVNIGCLCTTDLVSPLASNFQGSPVPPRHLDHGCEEHLALHGQWRSEHRSSALKSNHITDGVISPALMVIKLL